MSARFSLFSFLFMDQTSQIRVPAHSLLGRGEEVTEGVKGSWMVAATNTPLSNQIIQLCCCVPYMFGWFTCAFHAVGRGQGQEMGRG